MLAIRSNTRGSVTFAYLGWNVSSAGFVVPQGVAQPVNEVEHFAHLTNKEQAWKELLILTKDKHSYVRHKKSMDINKMIANY